MKWCNLRNPHPLGSFATHESVQSFKMHTVPDFVVPFRARAALTTIDHNDCDEMTFFATWLALPGTALAELQCLRNLRRNRRTKVSLTRQKALIELWGNNQTRARSSLPFYSIWTAR
jgi:hypothetical protein